MTQGMVSIVRGGAVLMKLVTGCDGYNAPPLAAEIRSMNRCPTELEAIALCKKHDFGYDAALVVSTPERDYMPSEPDEDFEGTLYRTKFSDPRFNPRWDYGTTEYLEIVELV